MERTNQLMEEYKILRSEILYFMNKDTSLLTCLFSGVTAVLFFALKENIIEGCLLSYLIIIPICSKLAYHQKQMAKIATYSLLFLENELEVKWETRIKKLSEQESRRKTSKFLKFSECPMMAFATVLVYGYLVVKNEVWKKCIVIFGIELFLMLILFVVVLGISRRIYKIKDYRIAYENQMKTID